MNPTLETETPLQRWVAGRAFCIVGGTGVIGRALVARLRYLGAGEVVVISRATDRLTNPDWRCGDISSPQFSVNLLPRETVVFHLAGIKQAASAAQDRMHYFEVNARGTWHVLEACSRAQVVKFVYASTGLVYGIPTKLALDETHHTAPISIYGASKLAGEAAVRGYSEELRLLSVIARISNVYSDLPDPETVWGRIISFATKGEAILLRNLESVRDYIHLEDVVEGLIRLAAQDTPERCPAVNLSTGIGTSAGRLAELIAQEAEALGRGKLSISISGTSAPERIPSLVLSNQRLEELTGWTPRIRVDDGMKRCLQMTIDRQDQ